VTLLRRGVQRTTECVDGLVADGHLARGAQICVVVGGEVVLDLAVGDDGTGRPMTPLTLCSVYCAIKPITAVAVAAQVEAGRLALDAPLTELLPEVRCARDGAITLRNLLNHTAGLHEPYAVHMELMTPDKRVEFVDRMRLPDGWRVGEDAGYSEFVAWHLLGRVLETTTGEPLRTHLRSAVLEPFAMTDTWIGMTDAEYDANEARIGVNHDLRAWVPFPMLLEQARRVCCETNPAYGGYTTARDLARFHAAVSARLSSSATLQAFCSGARERAYDVVLKRECEYGLGFMTGLADHHFGSRCSSAAFGHSGFSGTSYAFADPASDASVAVVLNGIADSARAFASRSALVDTIYEDLGLGR
jgi:CubicO group peptidase (beta-lactamase class C family)